MTIKTCWLKRLLIQRINFLKKMERFLNKKAINSCKKSITCIFLTKVCFKTKKTAKNIQNTHLSIKSRLVSQSISKILIILRVKQIY